MISDIIAPPPQIAGVVRTIANGVKSRPVQSTIQTVAKRPLTTAMHAPHGAFDIVEHLPEFKPPQISKFFEAMTKPQQESKLLQELNKPQQESKLFQGLNKPQQESKILQAITKPQQESKLLQGLTKQQTAPHTMKIRAGLPKDGPYKTTFANLENIGKRQIANTGSSMLVKEELEQIRQLIELLKTTEEKKSKEIFDIMRGSLKKTSKFSGLRKIKFSWIANTLTLSLAVYALYGQFEEDSFKEKFYHAIYMGENDDTLSFWESVRVITKTLNPHSSPLERAHYAGQLVIGIRNAKKLYEEDYENLKAGFQDYYNTLRGCVNDEMKGDPAFEKIDPFEE